MVSDEETKMQTRALRAYLAERYEVDLSDVGNGAELDEEHAGLYYGEPESWLVYGKMPNTNDVDWFYAGREKDLLTEMKLERG